MEHKLKLKFDDSFNGILFSTQGDTGRVFEIEVRDELDNAIDITGHKLEFYVGNDSKVTKVEGTIQGSKFIVKPVNEQFTKSGLNKAQFVLYDPQGLQVGSQIFDLHVEESIQNGATVGRNVLVDFSKINEALELIKGYEKTFEESKNLDITLSTHIDEGKKVNQELVSNTSAAQGLNENLKTSTTKASETYTKLEASRTGADTLNTDLKANIAQGNKTNANLQSSISTAKNTQSTLQEKTAQGIDANTKLGQSIKTGQDVVSKINAADKNLTTSITNADTAKTNLDASVDKANTAKTNLDASIDKANTTKTKLDESTQKGNTTDNNLKSTDSKASTSISTLKDLLNQSVTTEKNLKEIIASGNLDKYVTEPKLQEALAKIKTLKKEVVDTLPSTGQDDVIYLVKDSKGKDNNVYLEYIWLDKWELIGSTEVDLSGYAKTKNLEELRYDIFTNIEGEFDKKVDKTQITDSYEESYSDTVPSSKALSAYVTTVDSQIGVIVEELNKKVDKVEGKGLSTNDYTNEDKAKLNGIDLSKYVTDERFTGVTNEALAKVDTALEKSGNNEDHINQVDKKANDALASVKKVSSYAAANDARIDAVVSKVKEELSKKADKTEIADFKRCKVLTQSEYDALSTTEKNREDTLYFIKA